MNPELIVIGGYALRAFIPFSRFTRDCDFALMKKDGWNIGDVLSRFKSGASSFSFRLGFIPHGLSRFAGNTPSGARFQCSACLFGVAFRLI